jgi:hypothetical protein
VISLSTWYFYSTGPIDEWVGWHGLDHVSHDRPEENPWVPGLPSLPWLRHLIPLIAAEFKRDGWEGDGSWYLTALPDPDNFTSRIVIAVKQSNNGQVFMASQMGMDWFKDSPFSSRVVELPD